MTRDVYNKAMAVLLQLEQTVDKAISQLAEIERKEGIGFAKNEEEAYGLG